jgi:hypothetical protein
MCEAERTFSNLRGGNHCPDATSNLIPMQVIQSQCRQVTGDNNSRTFHYKDGRTWPSTVEGNEASFGPRDFIQYATCARLQEIMAVDNIRLYTCYKTWYDTRLRRVRRRSTKHHALYA